MNKPIEYLEHSAARERLAYEESKRENPNIDHWYLLGRKDNAWHALAMAKSFDLGSTWSGKPEADTPFGTEDELEDAILEFHTYLAEVQNNLTPAPGATTARPANQMVLALGRYFPSLGAHAARLLREREMDSGYDA
jgi:hypothetical protein